MAVLTLDTVYEPYSNGTLEVKDFDVDVYESNDATEPANETTMTLTQTLPADTVFQYGECSRWILFKSAGAAILNEKGLVKF